MLEDGMSFSSISNRYGINEKLLCVLWSKYQLGGYDAIKRGEAVRISCAKKKEIVRDIEENHITLAAASLKYGPSTSVIETWLRIARRDGIEALDIVKKRGRPPGAKNSQKTSTLLSALAKLQKENQDLKTEIAQLKEAGAV